VEDIPQYYSRFDLQENEEITNYKEQGERRQEKGDRKK